MLGISFYPFCGRLTGSSWFLSPIVVAFALWISALTVAGQSDSSSSVLEPVSRAELKAAVTSGEVITGRILQGEDIVAVLGDFLSSESTCAARGGLYLRKSTIRGDVTLKSVLVDVAKSKPKPAADDEAEDDDIEDAGKTPARWLSVPLSLTDSQFDDQFSLESIGLSCVVDLSRTTFENALAFKTTTFAADVIAESAVFKAGISALGSHFGAALKLRRARFGGNAEFIRNGRNLALFDGTVDCREAVFSRVASFIGSRFSGHMDFRNVQFSNDVNFGDSELGTGPASSFAGPFYMAEFGGAANFRNVRFNRLRFWRTVFRNGADFYRAHGQTLQLLGLTVRGPLAFDDAKLGALELNGFGGSMSVEGETILRRASMDKFTLNRVTFKKSVDMDEASIISQLRFRRVSFDGDLRLLDSTLPTVQADADKADKADRNEISIRDLTLNKGLFMGPDQFLSRRPWWAFWREDKPRFYARDEADDPSDSSAKDDRRLWRELLRAFDIAKNVELKNYAEYQLHLLEERNESGLQAIASTASRWFWGFGLRPLRTLFWLAVVILVFAGLYWRQLGTVASDMNPVSRFATRSRLALQFSARTAWQFKYGYDNSTTPLFRAITTVESILAKAILPCFAYALTQASPLLSEIMKKLLP